MSGVEITMLTSMADKGDFRRALDRFVAWELRLLDIKDQVWGKALIDLTDQEAGLAVDEIRQRGLATYCLSTMLFHQPIERGASSFRSDVDARLDRILELARIFQPVYIRLLSAVLEQRHAITDSIAYIGKTAPWLIECYKEAIEKICDAGFKATIENEARGNMLSSVQETVDFFELLDSDTVKFTWDIQNLWAMGTFPDLGVYDRLKPHIGYVHFKGGKTLDSSNRLHWRAPLEEASWPVEDICSAVVQDLTSPVLCLNRSHGEVPPNYDRDLEVSKDLIFLKGLVSRSS